MSFTIQPWYERQSAHASVLTIAKCCDIPLSSQNFGDADLAIQIHSVGNWKVGYNFVEEIDLVSVLRPLSLRWHFEERTCTFFYDQDSATCGGQLSKQENDNDCDDCPLRKKIELEQSLTKSKCFYKFT